MKKSKIKKAMKGNETWCCNFSYNQGGAKPCKILECPFKDNEKRLGKASELKECKSFWITEKTSRFESGVIVLVHPQVE